MKKIICTIAALSLILAGCGKEKTMVDDGDGAFFVAEKKTAEALPKMKKNTNTEGVGAASGGEDAPVQETTDSSGNVIVSGNSTENGGSVGDAAAPDEDAPENAEQSGNDDGSGSSSSGGNSKTTKPATTKKSDKDNSSSPTVTTKAVVSGSSDNAENDKPADNTPEKEPEQAAEDAVDIYYLEGIVYKAGGGSVIVNDPDLGFVTANFTDKSKSDGIRTGDMVLITHSGDVELDTLSTAPVAYDIEVTAKADEEYELEHFSCRNLEYDLEFSLLVPKSWGNKDIDYPTEGDFTDWGIRFYPEGENDGLDISWHSAFSVRGAYDIKPVELNGKKAKRYSKDNKWRFYAFDNEYIASNTFYGKSGYNEYSGTMEFMLSTLEFDKLDFI